MASMIISFFFLKKLKFLGKYWDGNKCSCCGANEYCPGDDHFYVKPFWLLFQPLAKLTLNQISITHEFGYKALPDRFILIFIRQLMKFN